MRFSSNFATPALLLRPKETRHNNTILPVKGGFLLPRARRRIVIISSKGYFQFPNDAYLTARLWCSRFIRSRFSSPLNLCCFHLAHISFNSIAIILQYGVYYFGKAPHNLPCLSMPPPPPLPPFRFCLNRCQTHEPRNWRDDVILPRIRNKIKSKDAEGAERQRGKCLSQREMFRRDKCLSHPCLKPTILLNLVVHNITVVDMWCEGWRLRKFWWSSTPPPLLLAVLLFSYFPTDFQGLTGLANTIPNASFRGLKQVMHADGMVFDAEYEVWFIFSMGTTG